MKDRLRECRLRCGLTQKFVALSLGVSYPSVSQWETGVNTPTIENLIQLADLYGATVDYLVGRDAEAPSIKPQQFDRAEARLVETYRALSKQGQEYIRQQLAIARQLYAGESGNAADLAR